MKKILNFTFVLFAIALVSCSSDDNIINQVDNNVERGAILRTIEAAPLNFDLREDSSSWSVTVEMEDNNQGNLLDKVDVFVRFLDNTPDNGTNPVDKSLVKTIPASDFVNGPNDLPRADLQISIDEAAAAAGLADNEFTGGDVFNVELELNLTDGRVFTKDDANGGIAGGSFFKSPYQYGITIIGCPPRPGEYTIEMTDAFGDGWQSTNADDGPGIQLFIEGELFREFGICTSYTDTQDEWCVGIGSSATDTFTIPEGVVNATWIFPGDFWGEMGFEIIGPQGQSVFSSAAGSLAAGEFFVVLCAVEE